jgi:hypothetical protein
MSEHMQRSCKISRVQRQGCYSICDERTWDKSVKVKKNRFHEAVQENHYWHYCKVKFYPNRERERDGQIERFYPKFFGYVRDRDGQKERLDFG